MFSKFVLKTFLVVFFASVLWSLVRLYGVFTYSGPPGAVVDADKLARDAIRKPELSGLQEWSIRMLSLTEAGGLHTNAYAPMGFVDLGSVGIDESQIPSDFLHGWGRDYPPEISLRHSDDGQPEAVVIEWYLSGVVIGRTNYQLNSNPWYTTQAAPGVFAYHGYK